MAKRGSTDQVDTVTPDWTRLEAVLRLLRGIPAAELAAEYAVDVSTLERWRDEFLNASMRSLMDDAAPAAADGSASSDRAKPRRGGDHASSQSSARPAVSSSSWREQAAGRAYTSLAAAEAAAAGGLRERKKARTRAEIRKHAMRLFHEQGYHETTVNEIAEAAEVSPSTFFRYFATKEHVVFQDDAENRLSETFVGVPADLSPVRAIFRGLLTAMASTSEQEAVRQQVLLCLSVPELRAVLFDNLTQLMNEIGQLASARTGRNVDDPDVRTFAAAVQGTWYSVLFDWAENPGVDLEAAMMRAADQLEAGLPL